MRSSVAKFSSVILQVTEIFWKNKTGLRNFWRRQWSSRKNWLWPYGDYINGRYICYKTWEKKVFTFFWTAKLSLTFVALGAFRAAQRFGQWCRSSGKCSGFANRWTFVCEITITADGTWSFRDSVVRVILSPQKPLNCCSPALACLASLKTRWSFLSNLCVSSTQHIASSSLSFVLRLSRCYGFFVRAVCHSTLRFFI